MSKNTNPRQSTMKKPDDLSSSIDNSGQPKLPSTYSSSNAQKPGQKPNSKTNSKVINNRGSQQFPPNLVKEISTEKASNQPETKSKQNTDSKTMPIVDKTPSENLQIEEESENIDSSIVKGMTDRRAETAPRFEDDDKLISDRSDKRRVTTDVTTKHQKDSSISNDVIQLKATDSSQQVRGSDAVPSQSSTVQKTKINLAAPKERSRSNSTVYRESPVKGREENSPSRKNSFISNNSNDLNLAKTQSLRTPGANTTNINFFSNNTVNVNNFNNVFFSGRNNKGGAPDSNTSRKNKSGFNSQKNPMTQSQSIEKSELPSQQPGLYRGLSSLSQSGAGPNTAYSASAMAKNIKVKSSNIKVVARFRPLNKMELELIDNGLGSDCSGFPNERSCYLVPDNQAIFTLDRIFTPKSTQDEVYDFVGRETIEDVLQGYNGTIFAYGQTSSGKTFTMYGDLHDSDLKGIIPRATQHIFDYIDGVEMEVEFVLKCSMLEIYKETLYDLLNERNSDLKIKEHPQRGIYVDGLYEENVVDEEELLSVIEIGEKSKMMAATRMNQHSSRSHTLFIMEITQKLPNQTEKKGRLNLVDLAGSEKVGKTGAQGDTLEEAKKINLSLSCLGNVIHSLTTNAEHIPYRDSKLTRILQESLGGNYKTTLVVTCSPHSSNREESISTLKFASRAKTIKTHYKMNVQISPESMAAMIEQLRLELEECRNELARYKNGEAPPELITMAENKFMSLEEAKRFSRFKPGRNRAETEEDFKVDWKVGGGIYTPSVVKDINKEVKKATIREPITESEQGFSKSYIDTENFMEEYAHGKKSYGTSYSYFKTNLELIKDNESLELKMTSYRNEVQRLNALLEEKDYQLSKAQDENMSLKNSLLQLEKQNSAMTEEWEFNRIKFEKHNDNTEHLNLKIQVLEKQVLAISEALIECECSIENLLKDKAQATTQKFLDYMNDNLEFKHFKLADYFDKSPNFNYEPFYNQINNSEDERDGNDTFPTNRNPYKESFISQLDLNSAFANGHKLSEYVEMPHKMQTMLQQNISTNINDPGSLSSEVQVYVLKHQLIQCMIINRHLERIIAALEWKQIIEYGKAKIKSNLTRVQERQIKNMEEVLQKAAVSHQQLRNRVEAVEMEGIRIRENLMSQAEKRTRMMTHIEGGNTKFGRVIRTVNREPTRKLGRRGLTVVGGPAAGELKGLKSNREAHELIRLNTAENDDDPQLSWRNRKESAHNPLASFKMDTPRVESMTNFVREIEKEISSVTKNPTNLDEAEIILNMKNEIIDKLFKQISSFGSTIIPQNTTMENTLNNPKDPQEEEYLKSEKERLENKVLIIQTELDLEKTKSEQLKEAYIEGAKQISHYKKLIEEMEISSRNALKLENENWQKVFDDLKANQDREMLRKQEELRKIHDLLAGWIFKDRYMDLQEQKGVVPTHQEKILYETFKRKEIPDRSLLEKPLLSVKLSIPQNPSTPKGIITDRKTHDSNKKSTTKH